jgi:hypothetical protein
MDLYQIEVGAAKKVNDYNALYAADKKYAALKRYFDGEAIYSQTQLQDLQCNLRLASYANALNLREELREHLEMARTRSFASANLTLKQFFHVLERDCLGAPDATAFMDMARSYVTS